MDNKMTSLAIYPESASSTVTLQDDSYKYATILKEFHLRYRQVDYYLQVGEITKTQGWILHITVVISQIESAIRTIIPILCEEKIPFKVVADKKTANDLLAGHLGISQIGKIICIYPENDNQAVALAKKLTESTTQYKGPAILTDVKLGSIVYSRYGSFSPMLIKGVNGNTESHIYSYNGELIKDNYTIPFQLPYGIRWPFNELANSNPPTPKKVLKNIYRYVSVLKTDPRGNVFNCVYLKNLFHVKKCVIKQGIQHMCSEESGRDVRDRLVWQQELHNELAGQVPLPKIFDLFEEDGNTYIAMDFIAGESLSDTIKEINIDYKGWPELETSKKIILVDYLIKITNIVAILHEKGYVHRDLAPGNFLINKKGQLYLIDLELAYSLHKQHPSPPFQFGTSGFMAPEQKAVSKPTTKEDIYGLGALILHVLSGLSPAKINDVKQTSLASNINFFIQNEKISHLITSCLENNSLLRPDITHIQKELKEYKLLLLSTIFSFKEIFQTNRTDITSIVTAAIEGLNKEPIIRYQDIWCSKTKNEFSDISIQQKEYSQYIGITDGVSGVLYLLARAANARYPIDHLIRNSFTKGWNFLEEQVNYKKDNLPGGFYSGKAGIALTIKEALEAGLLPNNEANIKKIGTYLSEPVNTLNIANGVSGKGISILQCEAYLNNAATMLQPIVDILLNTQQKNGEWLLGLGDKISDGKILSFSYGIPGIIWFLLQYNKQHPNRLVQQSAANGLNWLLKSTNNLTKPIARDNHHRKGSKIQKEYRGCILTLIKAYEVLQEKKYKSIAEEALSRYPINLVLNNFTQHGGMAFMGELYLEAAKVFNNTAWKHRADWIAGVFTHTFQKNTATSGYWKVEDYIEPTADLLNGNSGVIHFFLRNQSYDKIGYRLLQ